MQKEALSQVNIEIVLCLHSYLHLYEYFRRGFDALTKAGLEQTYAPPHEIGEYERTLNAHFADDRDFTEGIRVTLGNRAMTQDEVGSDADFLECWYVAQGG